MLRAAEDINASFSLTLFILELNYCILLVQGRYSSVLWLKVFALTADSDATTLLRIKSNTYCSVSVRLSRTSLAYRGIAYSHVFLLWLVTTKMCTHSEPNCASTTWISNISVYLSLYFYVH